MTSLKITVGFPSTITLYRRKSDKKKICRTFSQGWTRSSKSQRILKYQRCQGTKCQRFQIERTQEASRRSESTQRTKKWKVLQHRRSISRTRWTMSTWWGAAIRCIRSSTSSLRRCLSVPVGMKGRSWSSQGLLPRCSKREPCLEYPKDYHQTMHCQQGKYSQGRNKVMGEKITTRCVLSWMNKSLETSLRSPTTGSRKSRQRSKKMKRKVSRTAWIWKRKTKGKSLMSEKREIMNMLFSRDNSMRKRINKVTISC